MLLKTIINKIFAKSLFSMKKFNNIKMYNNYYYFAKSSMNENVSKYNITKY